MAKINIVLEGRFKGDIVHNKKDYLEIMLNKLDKEHVSSYEVIDQFDKDKHYFWSGVAGIVGTAGNKKEYLIAINWVYPKNAENNKSLIYIDEKYYKIFIRSMF